MRAGRVRMVAGAGGEVPGVPPAAGARSHQRVRAATGAPPAGNPVYRLLLCRFAGIGRAADVLRDADATAALTGHVL